MRKRSMIPHTCYSRLFRIAAQIGLFLLLLVGTREPVTLATNYPPTLADEGEKIIFGGIGQNRVPNSIGRANCASCHAFHENVRGKDSHAPNLAGAIDKAQRRLQDKNYQIQREDESSHGYTPPTSALEYLAESVVCHPCYVVPESGYAILPVNVITATSPDGYRLSTPELIAILAWLYAREGKESPWYRDSPLYEVFETAYAKFLLPSGWPKYFVTHPPPPGKTFDPPATAIPLVQGDESLADLFKKSKCLQCHAIPGIGKSHKTSAPTLAMKSLAPRRLRDKRYIGHAVTIQQYVTESILEPNLYVPSGYRPHIMPDNYGKVLPAIAVEKMVDYLAQLEEGKGHL